MSAASISMNRFEVGNAAEEAVLSAMLVTPAAIDTARRTLDASDFESERHRRIYEAMLAIADRGAIVDPLTVADELSRRGELERIGGKEHIGYLVDAVPTASNVEHHATIVVEYAQQRALEKFFEHARALTSEGKHRPADVVELVLPRLERFRGTRSRIRLLDDMAVEHMPPLEYLVDDLLPAESLIAVYGPPASGKSFAVLDLACCVVTGEPWLGHPIRRRGGVVYVAAEGTAGLSQRLRAWKASRDYTDSRVGVQFVLEALNLLDAGDRAALVDRIAQLEERPALIVFDTLHRSMPGGDENSAKDVGLVIENVDRIRRATGAAVLLVHHSRKDADVERGSTSLRGAVDTLLQIKPGDGTHTLTCEKQKDGPAFSPIGFSLAPLLGSCVVRVRSERDSTGPSTLTPHQRQALTILSRDFLSDGAASSQWLAGAKGAGISEATFWRARTALVREGYVTEKKGARGYARYTVSPSGQSVLGINYHGTVSPTISGQGTHYHGSHTPLGVRADDSAGAHQPRLTIDRGGDE